MRGNSCLALPLGQRRSALAGVVVAVAVASAPQASAAESIGPAAVVLGEAGVAEIAPEVMIDHILTAVMFDPDWRLALALFQAFQGAVAGQGEMADGSDAVYRLASELLTFLPMDQGRRAAPGLLLALAPEEGVERLSAAVELSALIGEDADALVGRTLALAAEQDKTLPLMTGSGLVMPRGHAMDPSPVLPPVVVDIIGDTDPDDLEDLIDADRQWGFLLYRLLTLIPDYQDQDQYARWYALWMALLGGAGWPIPPIDGGDTSSPR